MYKKLIFSTPLVAASAILIYLIRKYKKKPLKDDSESVNEVMFFRCYVCNHHLNKHNKCNISECVYNHILRMKSYITDAKNSLDICLYLITMGDMTTEIVRAHQRGVRVRIITDAAMSVSSGSKIETFRKNGLHVRMRSSAFLMHHKFIIIDKRVVLTGSLNWTRQGAFGNWDHIVITSQSDIVQQFNEEFNECWKILGTDN